MSEKVYRTMGGAGASGIAVGVVVLVTGNFVDCAGCKTFKEQEERADLR